MLVCDSVEMSSIMQFSLDGRLLKELILSNMLPWGMVAFRNDLGEALYVCTDEPFDAVNYGTPNPAGNRGAVLRVALSDDGSPLPLVLAAHQRCPVMPQHAVRVHIQPRSHRRAHV
jgi:hypothetical protein